MDAALATAITLTVVEPASSGSDAFAQIWDGQALYGLNGAGELFRCHDQARTPEAIAESRAESFYRGDLAQRIVHCAKSNGSMQPQGHVQMMVRIFGYGQNPQTACDAPRWHVDENFNIALEAEFSPRVVSKLEQRGHTIIKNPPTHMFGGAQVIHRLKNGYCAASDPRKDGQAVGY